MMHIDNLFFYFQTKSTIKLIGARERKCKMGMGMNLLKNLIFSSPFLTLVMLYLKAFQTINKTVSVEEAEHRTYSSYLI